MKTFLNLSNGIEKVNDCSWDGFIRIQSSHLEKAHWEEVLLQLDNNFLMWVANGPVTIIDGGSARGENARSCWQGIPWITYALERAWFNNNIHTVLLNKYNVTNEYKSYYEDLSKKTLRKLKYFRTYLTVDKVDIRWLGFHSTIDDKKELHRDIWRDFLKTYKLLKSYY